MTRRKSVRRGLPAVSSRASAAQSAPTPHREGRLHIPGRPFDTARG